MKKSLPVLDEISIPIHCSVSWDSMMGSDRERHCAICNQTVHDLSSMSSAEAIAFVTANQDNACVRFYKRTDGTVVTRDCKGEHSGRGRGFLRRAVLALVSWLGLSLIGGCYQCVQGKPAPPKGAGRPANQNEVKQDAAKPGEGNVQVGKQ